jgi:release factor glutamine methyltransferase
LPTIDDAIREAALQLAGSAIDEPRRTAGVLLGSLLGVDRAYLLTRADETITDEQHRAFIGLVSRRADGEPLQYITGRQEFFGLELLVNRDVLIPRPETEHLVEQAIRLSRSFSDSGCLIVDAGTGSGCVAIALAVNLPDVRLAATDVSSAAIAVASQNADRHRVADRITFLEGDLLSPLRAAGFASEVDIIASNPPYVPDSEVEHLQREIREHEPEVALRGGTDGLDFYRRLLDESPVLLKAGGYLVCEIGFSQLAGIQSLVDSVVWERPEVTADLQGIPRVLTFRKR